MKKADEEGVLCEHNLLHPPHILKTNPLNK